MATLVMSPRLGWRLSDLPAFFNYIRTYIALYLEAITITRTMDRSRRRETRVLFLPQPTPHAPPCPRSPSQTKQNKTKRNVKVEAVRGERDLLRQQRAALEDKLADVEKFQSSKRGQALDRMEQDLAAERMARVELEADRDDLQSQLAAALQATGRR